MTVTWDADREAASAAKKARDSMVNIWKKLPSDWQASFKAAEGQFRKTVDEAIGPSVKRAYAAGRGDEHAVDTDKSARGEAVDAVVTAVTTDESPLPHGEPWDAIEQRIADVAGGHIQKAYARGQADAARDAKNTRN